MKYKLDEKVQIYLDRREEVISLTKRQNIREPVSREESSRKGCLTALLYLFVPPVAIIRARRKEAEYAESCFHVPKRSPETLKRLDEISEELLKLGLHLDIWGLSRDDERAVDIGRNGIGREAVPTLTKLAELKSLENPYYKEEKQAFDEVNSVVKASRDRMIKLSYLDLDILLKALEIGIGRKEGDFVPAVLEVILRYKEHINNPVIKRFLDSQRTNYRKVVDAIMQGKTLVSHTGSPYGLSDGLYIAEENKS